MKTYFLSPLNKRSLVSKRLWTNGNDSIFEHCRWFDGVISISVPSGDRDFDPYFIIKNANNEWRKYAHELTEGYDGNIEWDYGICFEPADWRVLATKMETDIREELQQLGWNVGAEKLFIEGEIEIDTSETRSVRNNYNLEW